MTNALRTHALHVDELTERGAVTPSVPKVLRRRRCRAGGVVATFI
jgi:hypothetical protein